MPIPPYFRRVFIHPGRLFVLSSVNSPAMYHIPGTGKGLFRVKLVKVHAASMPCALVESLIFFIVDAFYATVLIRIAEVSRPVRPCVLCVRRRADPFVIFCFYDISSGVFLGCLPWFKPDLPVFIKFNADVIIAYFSSYFGQYRAVLKVNNVMPVLCALVKGCFILQGI